MTPPNRTFLSNLLTSISSAGFRESFTKALSDNAIWTATGTLPLAGRYEGKHQYVTKVRRPLHDRLESSPKPEVARMIVDGGWVAMQFRSSAARGLNGADFSMQYCWLMGLVDGRIMEVVGFCDQKKMCDLLA
jgi:ketosteroid isomerase-like protein